MGGLFRRLWLILAVATSVLAVAGAGCGSGTSPRVTQAAPGRITDGCPQTPTIRRREPGVHSPSFWYGVRGGSLSLAAAPLYAGDNKVGWLRPRGEAIRLAATLHSGIGPRLVQTISPAGYSGISQPSGITFPVAGCWDITATAGRATSHFTVRVFPASYRLAQGCFGLRDAARKSVAVVVARINARVPEGPNTWVGAVVSRVLAGRVPMLPELAGGFSWWSWQGQHEIELLERPGDPYLAAGDRYLLFLTAPPGAPLGLACGGSPGAARLEGARVVPLVRPPLWHGQALDSVTREIRAAFAGR